MMIWIFLVNHLTYTCNMTDENEFYFWDEMWNEEKNNKKNEKNTTKNSLENKSMDNKD